MAVLDSLINQAAILVIICCALPLFASAASGLVIAVLQTATQIQEQTIQYLSKLFILLAMAYFFGAWMFESLSQLFIEAFRIIALIGVI